MPGFRYFLLNKPYGVLSQFTREIPSHRVLSDVFDFPPGVYPVGRLDQDSEGLLLLTDDKSLNQRLLDPVNAHPRTYFAQVEGLPEEADLAALSKGVRISVDGKAYQTKPARVQPLQPQPLIAEREPPIRFRAHIPTTWIELELTEGKNRQVRKMCAAAGFPVLRLIRQKIGRLDLSLLGGKVCIEISRESITEF